MIIMRVLLTTIIRHCQLNAEVSTPKRQHLMIIMRVLLTTIIGHCQLNAEFVIACLYIQGCNKIHDQPQLLTSL